MKISKMFRFEASHQIENHPGKCARLHGHSWVLIVTCEGKIVPETGMVRDYETIKRYVDPLVARLDHHHLGYGIVEVTEEIKGKRSSKFLELNSTVDGFPKWFLPTSENLLWWIASQVPPELPWCTLELSETCTSSATLTREEYEQKGGKTPHGETKGHEEGREEREEVPEEGKEVTLEGVEKELHITDDDIPF